MIIFSASPASKKVKEAKGYYKDFKKVVTKMENMGKYLRDYSISSFTYTAGQVKSVKEECIVEGHRAYDDIDEAGNILLIDIDNKFKSISYEDICEKFKDWSAYISVSRSYSEETPKFHIVIELDQLVPKDAGAFFELYCAVLQKLGLDGYYDPAMRTPVQNMTPHGRTDAVPEQWFDGEVMPVQQALDEFVPAEEHVKSGGAIVGEVPADTSFTLSDTGESVNVEEMAELVWTQGKQRVHCIAGYLHDGRADTAFVNETNKGSLIYHCSGGRCGHTLVLPATDFKPESGHTDDFEVEVIVDDTPDDIWGWADKAIDILKIEKSRWFLNALNEDAQGGHEAALGYLCTSILKMVKAKLIEGELCIFVDTQWVPVFKEVGEETQWIRAVAKGAKYPSLTLLAHRESILANVSKLIRRSSQMLTLKHHKNMLNLQNCMVHISRKKIEPLVHHPAMLFRHTLPYSYDPKAECPVWEATVKKLMCGRTGLIRALQQAMGYLLLRDTQYEKMIGFVGEGENGKSTVARVLKNLVGRSGYSAVPIKKLLSNGSEGDYSRAELQGKLINITNELTPATLEADAFKDLVSGEDITARRIYGTPFELATVPKQLCSMNTTDRLVQERSHGYMRRLHLIPFDYRIKESDKDPEFNEKLEAEMSGILNWCIEGAQAVIKAGKLESSKEMLEMLGEVERDGNPALRFKEQWITLHDTDYENGDELIAGQEMYNKYLEFCNDNGNKPLGKNNFFKELRRLQVPYIKKSIRVDGAVQKAVGWFCELNEEEADNVVPFKPVKN